MISIYHNPRCSKSRAALELVQQFSKDNHVALVVIDYLKSPLNLTELRVLQKQLGKESQRMVRGHDVLDSAQQCEILLAQPELLQRPVISYQGRAVIGRPIELIYPLLKENRG